MNPNSIYTQCFINYSKSIMDLKNTCAGHVTYLVFHKAPTHVPYNNYVPSAHQLGAGT